MGKSDLRSLTTSPMNEHRLYCHLTLPHTVQTHLLPPAPNSIRQKMISARTAPQHPQVHRVKVRCFTQWIRCRLAAWMVGRLQWGHGNSLFSTTSIGV